MSEPKDFSTEVIRQVYDNAVGYCVEVGRDRDGLECVEVRTSGKSAEHFGEIRFVLPPEMARLLGWAIIASADEIKKKD